jgi:hypothetical protein
VSNPVQALEVAGSAVVAGTLSAGNPLMFRNAIINGDMRINQRGISTNWASPTAVGSVTGGIYATDRWNVFRGSYQTGACVAQGTLATTDAPYLQGLQYFLRVGRVNGDTGTQSVLCTYNIETRDSYRFAGGPVTISYYYRTGSGFSGTTGLLGYSGTGIDGAVRNALTGQVLILDKPVPNTNTWQCVSFTGFVPLSSAQVAINIYGTASGTAGGFDYFDITGVQLEKGTVATPFEVRPYGVELALCQRYYYQLNASASAYTGFGLGVEASSSQVHFNMPFSVPMRVAPSAGFSNSATTTFQFNVGGGNPGTVNGFTVTGDACSVNMGWFYITASNTGTPGLVTQLRANNTTSAFIAWSAEL